MRTLLPACALALLALAGCSIAGSSPGTDDSGMDEDMSDQNTGDTTVVAEGTFSGRSGHNTSGAYQILRTEADDDLLLQLTEDFETAEGPDLHVILSPVSPDDATGSNVNGEEAIEVSELTAPIGQQSYALSDDVDPESFNTVAIHCIEYEALFGAAELE